MQNTNFQSQPKDASTKQLHDYLSNNYYKQFVALSLIFMFAIVFYLIYLLIDTFIDKNKHYKLSLRAYEKYEQIKREKKSKNNKLMKKDENEIVNKQNSTRNVKLDFTVWSNRNLQISFLHSVLCSLWLMKIIWFRNNEMFNDLLTYVSWDTYLVIAFSCGYFLYDFYDIWSNGYFKLEFVVCLHHWIVLVSFSYHMMNLLNIGYTILALLMEFNSVFLHSRKLLKFYGFSSSSNIFRINNILNVTTFIIFRFGTLVLIYMGIFRDHHRVTFNYLVMLCSCVFAMTIINVVLFKRILLKDCIKRSYSVSYNKIANNETEFLANEQIDKETLIDGVIFDHQVNKIFLLANNQNKNDDDTEYDLKQHQISLTSDNQEELKNGILIKKSN